MRRVVVSGVGVVSPLGNGASEVLAQAVAGRSGVRRLDTPFAARLAAPLAATAPFDAASHFDVVQLRMLDRFSQFALYAAKQAVAASDDALGGLDPARGGVFVGTGMGGTLTMDDGYRTLYGDGSDRIKPFTVLMGMHNAAAAWIGIEHALRGANLTYSTACSSAAVAIGEAWLRVASGQLEVAIAGGAEAPLSCGSLKAWEALHTVAAVDADEPSHSCRPFSKNRSGMVLGEGAAMFVIEPRDRALARGATVHGEILGCGVCNDAGHITRPSVEGQAAAMRAALQSAGIAAQAIDAINAHGTGTQANDGTETAAIKAVFGDHARDLPISATKAIHGHLLGAAGALEALLSLLAMQQALALPTMHLQVNDPECDLDYVPDAVRRGVAARTMLSNSFAFGGSNAVLVLGLRTEALAACSDVGTGLHRDRAPDCAEAAWTAACCGAIMPITARSRSRLLLWSVVAAPLLFLFGCTVNRLRDAAELARLSEPLERRVERPQARLLIVGDSTAVGTGASTRHNSLAGLLARTYPGLHIDNRGRDGATFAQLLPQLDGGDRYDIVLIQAGGNDVIRLRDLDTVAADIDRVLRRAGERADRVLVMPAGNVGNAPFFFAPVSWWMTSRARRLHQAVREIAARHGAVYVDLFKERRDDPFAQRPELNAHDGLHPSDAGYRVWFEDSMAQSGLAQRLEMDRAATAR